MQAEGAESKDVTGRPLRRHADAQPARAWRGGAGRCFQVLGLGAIQLFAQPAPRLSVPPAAPWSGAATAAVRMRMRDGRGSRIHQWHLPTARPGARRPRSGAATTCGRMGMRGGEGAASIICAVSGGEWRTIQKRRRAATSPGCRHAACTPVARLRGTMLPAAVPPPAAVVRRRDRRRADGDRRRAEGATAIVCAVPAEGRRSFRVCH